jgi:hypothetical protein
MAIVEHNATFETSTRPEMYRGVPHRLIARIGVG